MSTTRQRKKITQKEALRVLKEIFLRGGYYRVKNIGKAESFGSQTYKKGYEIRFMPKSKKELELLREAISSLGLYVSKPFKKRNRIVQPLYGKTNMLSFKNLLKPPKLNQRSR